MNHQDIDRRSLMMHRIIAARLRAKPDRVAVMQGSRGLQPTGEQAAFPCRVATPHPDSKCLAVPAVSLRDTGSATNHFRGLKPTATMRHHYVVKRHSASGMTTWGALPEEGRHSVDPCRADRMSALLKKAS
jgi:hypothetical protein